MDHVSLSAMSERQNRPATESKSEANNRKYGDGDRAQVTPRLIVGGFVLLVIAGPLLTVAVDLQAALASTPAFTGLSAAVIAILIVMAITAAALDLE